MFCGNLYSICHFKVQDCLIVQGKQIICLDQDKASSCVIRNVDFFLPKC